MIALVESLVNQMEGEESVFRRQLLKEDIARLERLQSMAKETGDADGFVRAGIMIGWTQGDMRTHQIRPALEDFLRAFHAHMTADEKSRDERALQAAWDAFCQLRMEKLIRCL